MPPLLLLPLVVFATLPAWGQSTDVPQHEQTRILEAVETLLADRFPADAHRLQVRVVRFGGLDSSNRPLLATLRTPDALPRAHTRVDLLSGSDADGWSRAGWAMLYVAHYDSVAVAGVRRAADEALRPGEVDAAWLETTSFRGEPLHPAAFRALSADGEVFAARPLQTGRALRSGDLRPAFAADTGDTVVMRYRRGRIAMNLTCTAREPGFNGQIIRLYGPDTDTTYRARLTGPGAAEWIETR